MESHQQDTDQGEERRTAIRVLSFEPLQIELPEEEGPLPLPVWIELPGIRVTVRRLLSDVFDPAGHAPSLQGTLPGPAYKLDNEEHTGEIELGKLVEFIAASRADLRQIHHLYQKHFDDHGALLDPVI